MCAKIFRFILDFEIRATITHTHTHTHGTQNNVYYYVHAGAGLLKSGAVSLQI